MLRTSRNTCSLRLLEILLTLARVLSDQRVTLLTLARVILDKMAIGKGLDLFMSSVSSSH